MKRNKKDLSNLSDITKTVYILLRNKYGYTLRISNFWKLLTDSVGINEFELINFRELVNGEIETFLMDYQIKWMNGEDVDFFDIVDMILRVGDFTRSEKELFESGNMEDRVFGIYLSICNPELEEIIN